MVFTREHQLRIEAYLDCGDRDRNKRLFDDFFEHSAEWEAKSGFPLVWERLDEARASRIASYDPFWLPGGEAQWDAALQQTIVRTIGLLNAFETPLRERATQLKAEMPSEPDPASMATASTEPLPSLPAS